MTFSKNLCKYQKMLHDLEVLTYLLVINYIVIKNDKTVYPC